MHLQVWAPKATVVEVVPADPEHPRLALTPQPDRPGWHAGEAQWLRGGSRYRLSLDGSEPVNDPLARRWPAGSGGPSQIWDPTCYQWSDHRWGGRSLGASAAIYELHVGTFTPDGTLDGAIARLPHLRRLGVTHVELMPLASFDGPHGWGYDGVALNCVHEAYGGPDALCRFVDAAHRQGLAVMLDVVHNHLGPSGNVWDRFGPFVTDVHRTPWGGAINLDAPGSDDVRAILLSSALGWFRDFHVDGLRLDAVHELHDSRALTYLEELSAETERLSGELGRPLTLVAETDRNDPATVTARADGGVGMTAQWDDDVHHALHWLLTGETHGYYADFGSASAVGHALESAFLHDGRWSSFRGRTHGRPVDWSRVEPWRFVVSLQTHDQVGNRALGERLISLAGGDLAAAGAALLLTLPYTPMLFMGEEWGADAPWQYFTSFDDPQLGAAVTAGRREEFAGHGWADESIPDPQDPATFERSVLPAPPTLADPAADLLRWYADLLALRAHEPQLAAAEAGPAATAGGVQCSWGGGDDVRPAWFMLARGSWRTVVNLSAAEQQVPLGGPFQVRLDWRGCAGPAPGDQARLRLSAHGSAVVRVSGQAP